MITILINNIDVSSQIDWASAEVEQILTSEIDTARFAVKQYGSKTFVPAIGQEVSISDGATKIFGGYIISVDQEELSGANGLLYSVQASDYTATLAGPMVSASYLNQTGAQIIAAMISAYAPAFTVNNVIAPFTIVKMIYNNVPLDQAIKKLADTYKYEWYVDENKDVHFFPQFSNPAPFSVTDNNGIYVKDTFKRTIDGSQMVNQVIVRGGEGDGTSITDVITISGSLTQSVILPFKFTGLQIWLDTGSGYVAQTVGVYGTDAAAGFNCLYSYSDSVLYFPAALASATKLKFTGIPKIIILSTVKDSASISAYGLKVKMINDSSILDLSVARSRAKAELAAYLNQSDSVTFDTKTAGLRAGQTINVTSTKRTINTNYLIKRLVFKTYSATNFIYSADLITQNLYSLNELLQKLLTPPAEDPNDTVIAETILIDLNTINISELIRVMSPSLVLQNLSAAENIQKDPLGAGVEPTWVLGPYTPTSPTDPKRWGHLDGSLKLY